MAKRRIPRPGGAKGGASGATTGANTSGSKPGNHKVARRPEDIVIEAPKPAVQIGTVDPNEFYFLPDFQPSYPTETELHDMIKAWRHGRATRSIWETIQEGYVMIFTVLVLGAMLISVVQSSNTAASGCTATGCGAARILLAPTLALTFATLALTLSRLFGPIVASAAEGYWLFGTPVTRTKLLGKRLLYSVLLGILAPALIVLLITAFTGAPWSYAGLWAAAAGLLCAGMVAFAGFEQTREGKVPVAVLKTVTGLLALVGAGFLVSTAAGWIHAPIDERHGLIAAGSVAGFGLVVLVISFINTKRFLHRLKRTRLVSGGDLVAGMQGAMYALDFGLMRDILVEREAYQRGSVRPRKGAGLGINAIIVRDFMRIARFPKPLIAWAASMVVPYALGAMGITQLMPFISGLVLVAVLVPFLQTMRVFTRTDGLRRLFPYKNTTLRQTAMVMPGFFALIWMFATYPAIAAAWPATAGDHFRPWSVAFFTAFGGLMGAVRWTSAGKVNFNTPMVATDAGAVPPTLILNLFRGIDMVALITAPIILGANPLWSTGIAALVFYGMRGSFNMEEMQAAKEAADRELAEAKAAKEKKKISRGR